MTESTTILIVDDELAMSTLYKEILDAAGYRTLLAGDAEEALTILARMKPPQLVLLDYRLPKMTPGDFLDAVKVHTPRVLEESRIFGFSSLAGKGYFEDDSHRYFSGFVDKPFEPEGITELVASVLAQSWTPPSAASRASTGSAPG